MSEWTDVEPASAVPWCTDDEDDARERYDVITEAGAAVADFVSNLDAAYIVTCCNERPALLAKLAEQVAELESLRETLLILYHGSGLMPSTRNYVYTRHVKLLGLDLKWDS